MVVTLKTLRFISQSYAMRSHRWRHKHTLNNLALYQQKEKKREYQYEVQPTIYNPDFLNTLFVIVFQIRSSDDNRRFSCLLAIRARNNRR